MVQKTKTVYFCAGWFTDKQNKAYQNAMNAIKENPTVDVEDSYVPLDHQYKGLRVDEHPELLEDREWATATYNGDRVGVSTSDLLLAVYIPNEEDVGMGVELGMASALGKHILVVIPDEDWGKPINLMSWGIGDQFIKMSELATFDFNKPTFNFYDGAVY
ncbi:nucleoside 2-deoxyribosyltransferase [Limosilactobacillus fastidiosus]|uniref:Nucleoside 2-deoxyribosyltransferase n=1 Tax=Limosilactobacillus fastidiosus TaxID=2759855 RepID=A0A7W3YCH7_9LACO|nr:nucleoside 2-deoxyribosyltransferase [Limosilactobacillus fastidiosus]MBB1063551.1 nucleoside 2-deoxyribosyltransferase [Limosilactobacillus fastidiosus]MBB1086328.1 nucleoside 2-deoxyribosyltransferase [Limosilactobacillus fastidiosus]MCD7084017.1 nucleoside 2-deoxyribosyltransferase [Limosilactobacillus fastidiosus]MCD7086433.1 nucleoside 2-deoxyribosyltransferase [Limosilactobacillus fastidiosus]MCD7114211.1 nucleoside 2-deoxyribosyltransferase [Limosilactobacillus fastidiosus]